MSHNKFPQNDDVDLAQPDDDASEDTLTDDVQVNDYFVETATELLAVRESVPSTVSDVPVVMATGFLETANSAGRFADNLAKEGERTVSIVNHPRKGGDSSTDQELLKKYSPEHIARAGHLLAAIEASGAEQVDIVGHSQGCIDAVVAAIIDSSQGSNRIRNLALLNLSGASDPEPPVGELAKRLGKSMLQDTMSAVTSSAGVKSGARALASGFNYLKSNPQRALNEFKAVARTSTLDDMALLRERGIGIATLVNKDDNLFPLKEQHKNIRSQHVDSFYTQPGAHNELVFNPEQQAQTVSRALRELAARHSRPTENEAVQEIGELR